MLLTILNLPNSVKYGDIKALISSKCNIDDLILDNLSSHDKNSKKITIGLSGEEDAALVMRNINGFYMDGRQLQVIQKTKTSESNAHNRPTNAMPSLCPPGPNIQAPRFNLQPPATFWYGSNFPMQGPGMGNQNSPAVIPPLMNYASQTAYYQMNQPAYPTQPTTSTEKVGYPELNSYGNRRNQSDNQNDWSSNVWSQQPFSGFLNTQENNNPGRWESNQESQHRGTKWVNNRASRWDSNNDSPQEIDENLKCDNNRGSRWDNDSELRGGSKESLNKRDSRDLNRSQSPDSAWYSRRSNNSERNRDSHHSNPTFGNTDDLSYKRNNLNNATSSRYNPSYAKNDQNRDRSSRDSSYMRSDQNNARFSHEEPPYTRNDRNNARTLRQKSPFSRNERGHGRSSRHDTPSLRIERDNARSSRRDPSYVSNDRNQPNTPRQDSAYSRNDRVNAGSYRVRNNQTSARPTLGNISGEPEKNFVGNVRNQYDKTPRQHENNAGPRPLFDQYMFPPAKRARLSNSGNNQTQPKNKFAKGNKTPGFTSGFNAISKKIATRQTPVMPMDPTQIEQNKWRTQITGTVASRTMKHRCCVYEGVKPADVLKHIKVAVRERMDSRLQKKKYVTPKSMAQNYYGKFDHASHCDLIQEAVESLGGKMLVCKFQPVTSPKHTSDPNVFPGNNPRVAQRQGPPQKYPVRGVNNPDGIPLALLPGRIPQYPQGDKKIYKKNKKEAANLFKDHGFLVNLMSGLPPAIRNGIGEEMEIFGKVIAEACNEYDPDGAIFIERAKCVLPQKLKTVTKVNLTRRMLPILPIQVSIYSTPKVKRCDLEKYLTAYNVMCLKKSKSRPVYLADCNSVEDHDNLCLMGPVNIAGSTVNFKPFHLAGAISKIKKADILKQNARFKKLQIRYFDRNFGNTLEEAGEDVEDYMGFLQDKLIKLHEDNPVNVIVNNQEKSDLDIKGEQLRKDIKQIYEQISDPTNIKSETGTDQFNAEPSVTMIDSEINNDFSTDIDVDNFANNVIEDTDNGYLPVGQVGATSWNEDGEVVSSTEIKTESAAKEDHKTDVEEDKTEVGNEKSEVEKEKPGVKKDNTEGEEDNKEVEEDDSAVAEDIDIDDVNEDDLEDW